MALPSAEAVKSAPPPLPVSNLAAQQEAKGFKDVGNGLAFRWTTNTADSPGCDYHDSYVTLEVLAYESCSFVYIEGNVLNDSGTIIGYTNDTVQNMSPGNITQVVLPILEYDGSKVKLEEMKCM